MARQIIAIGSAGNDGTGDTLRSGAIKMNKNFTELYQTVAGLQLLVADSSGGLNLQGVSFDQGGVVFIGQDSPNSNPADNNETYLLANEPTKDNTIYLPDSSGRIALITDIRDNTLDSAAILQIVGSTLDSAEGLQLIRDNSIDSLGVIGLVDAAYIQARQDPGGLDSSEVRTEIDTYVTKSYLVSNNLALDSALVYQFMIPQTNNQIDSSLRNVDLTVKPIADDTYDIGTSSLKFRNLNLSNEVRLGDSGAISFISGVSNSLRVKNIRVLRIDNADTEDSIRFRLGHRPDHPNVSLSGHFIPSVDSAFDLGDSDFKWKDLHLSGNTIHLGGVKLKATGGGAGLEVLDVNDTAINLGGGLTEAQVDGRIALNSLSLDSASILIDSSFNDKIPTSDIGKQYFVSKQGTNNLSPDFLIRVDDKFVDNNSDLAEELLDAPTLQDVFNTWDRFSHDTSATQPANPTEMAAWGYNSGSNTVSSTVNSTTVTGFYSPEAWDNFTLDANIASASSDDDIIFLVAGFVVDDNGREHTLTVYRQGTGLAAGLGNYGIIYNLGQTDQAVLTDGSSLANTGSSTWNLMGSTRLKVEKRGTIITATTAQFGGTTLDGTTTISFDLSTNANTQKFAGSVKYGYGALSQDNATFSNIVFTPDNPVTLIHFGGTLSGNDGGDIYVYEDQNTQWGLDSDLTLSNTKGRIYHNNKTGRTYWNDGTAGYAIGSVRQFNDVIYLTQSDAEPDSADTGGLGLRAGMIATADGNSWNPANFVSGTPYPVFYNGTDWISMIDSAAAGGGGGGF